MDVLRKQTSVPSFTELTQLLYQKALESQTPILYRRQGSKMQMQLLNIAFPNCFLSSKKKRLVEKDEGGKLVI